MRHVILLVFLLCAFSAQSADRVTAIITVTNVPANNATITLNGNVRTWRNSVTTDSMQILVASSIGGSATNLYEQITRNPYSGGIRVSRTSTNDVQLHGGVGQTMSVSFSGNWASVTYSTQTVATLTNLSVPLSAWPNQTDATNAATALVSALNTYPTQAINQNAAIVSELVGKTNAQTVSSKTFTNSFFSGGVISNVTFAGNCSFQFGDTIHAGLRLNVLTQSERDATGAVEGYIVYNSSNQHISFVDASGVWHDLAKDDDTGPFLRIDGTGAMTGNLVLANGITLSDANTNGTLLSSSVNISTPEPTETNHLVTKLYVDLNHRSTNSTLAGTNKITGDLSFARFDNSSLASGNNAAVNPGTNVYMKVSGPAAAFTINGITGGRDGRILIIQNSTGYAFTIANDSGVDPAAGNRIYTGTAADISITNNPGFVELIYDANYSRWCVKSKSN